MLKQFLPEFERSSQKEFEFAPNFLGKVGEALGGVAGAASAVGTVAGVAGDLFGKSSTEQGATLPPELEFELIERTTQDLEMLDQQYQQIVELQNIYQERIQTIESSLDAQIPDSQVIEQLRDTNIRLAQTLGASAEELAAQGFISDADAADLKELDRLQEADFEDPRLERELSDQKAQLEQQLRRSGASPAVRAQALAQFEQQAEEQRFGRRQQLRQSETQFIGQKMGLRAGATQQGLSRLTSAMGANQGQLSYFGQVDQARANLAGISANTSAGLLGQAANTRGQARGALDALSKYKFSGAAKDALSQGGIGPGSSLMKPDARREFIEKYNKRNKGVYKPAGTGAGPIQDREGIL